MSGPIVRGVCRFCKVTDAEVDGDKLSWFTRQRDVCSSLPCIRAYNAKQREERDRIEQFNRKCRAEARDRRRRDLERRGLLKPKKGAA